MADGMTSERREAGRRLLAALDEIGMDPVGAAWVHDADLDDWFYLLVSPLVDERGPFWIYERLMRLFARQPLPPEISPLDLRIYSPFEAGVSALASFVAVDGGEAELRDCSIDGMQIDHAILYRMRRTVGTSGDLARRFDQSIRMLEAA